MEELEPEFMFMADGAHVVGGKVYVLGGAWTHLYMPAFPGRPNPAVSVVVGLRVPYNLTNRKFRFALRVVDSDGEQIDEPATGEFEMGRPPGLRPGSSQRFMVAGMIATEFPRPGRYLIEAIIDGAVKGSTWFELGEATAV